MHWDFALILLFFATAVPLLGRLRIQQLMRMAQTRKRDRLRLYTSTVAFQWLAVGVIVWRASAHNLALAELGIAVPHFLATLIATLVLASLVLANQLISLRRITTHPETVSGILPQLALKIFPQDSVERVAFFFVVLTVAVCEEVIFRGFAQRIFEIWSRGMSIAGIVGSAALFALAHLYQGRRGLIATFVVGLIFSFVRYLTGSLIAPFVAHFIADITAGFLAPARLGAALVSPQADSGPSLTP
jgi:membrane protease YdiL (CAAX protease family)